MSGEFRREDDGGLVDDEGDDDVDLDDDEEAGTFLSATILKVWLKWRIPASFSARSIAKPSYLLIFIFSSSLLSKSPSS